MSKEIQDSLTKEIKVAPESMAIFIGLLQE
jgi:hypothetical protein